MENEGNNSKRIIRNHDAGVASQNDAGVASQNDAGVASLIYAYACFRAWPALVAQALIAAWAKGVCCGSCAVAPACARRGQ